jgi:UTP--glucose-1-phosphate uridylyltransferase
MKVKKAIIPVAGLGSRFLPLSKVMPKEFWPLVDRPVIQYIVQEAKESGIKEIIFVSKPGREMAFDYFTNKLESKKTSFSKYKNQFEKDLEDLEDISKKICFFQAFQKEPLGAAHAVLQAEKFIGREPCAILWADDIVEAKTPCLAQLIKIYEKYQKSVVALYKTQRENFHFYGMIKGKKINNRLYDIQDFIEKPKIEESPSDMAIVGKYIITPKVFDQLKKINFDLKSDITLSTVLVDMAKAGENLLGCQFEGKWLECGNKLAYLKSNFYLSLKNPHFGKDLKKFIRNNNR